VTEEGCAGTTAEPVPDVIDDAIEEALHQGCHVDVVEDAEARTAVDGLAALLRFTRG
jgi:peptide subunit release factor 1 (eRF1)